MGTLQTNISHPFSFEGDMFVAAEPNASEALFWLSYIASYQFFSLLRTESEVYNAASIVLIISWASSRRVKAKHFLPKSLSDAPI